MSIVSSQQQNELNFKDISLSTDKTPHMRTHVDKHTLTLIDKTPSNSVTPQPQHTDKDNDNLDVTDKFYEIEEIISRKFCIDSDFPDGQWYYRVKWHTFPAKYNSWVSYSDLNASCQKFVTEASHTVSVLKGSKKVV